jgi:glycosyltransferase involved in cell wall biosynthesis
MGRGRLGEAMKILFVHQNFLGQFRHLATELAREPGNQTVSLSITPPKFEVPGLRTATYKPARGQGRDTAPLALDFEAKVIRAEACANAALALKQQGFLPDVIVAHPGWGEHMFLRDVWPQARILMFLEFFYRPTGLDVGFDSEFEGDEVQKFARLRSKNANLLTALDIMDWGYSPTHWQRNALPEVHRPRTSVIFDGIDTEFITADTEARFDLPDGRSVKAGYEVLTFINRNLEPYRGFHVFMRALPAIQQARPAAITLIVGGEGVSYGAPPKEGGSWKDVMLREVGDRLDMSRIVFLGNLPYAAYRQLLRVSRAHAYLTYPFVLSWSALEAMAAECLLVGSRTGPVTEMVSHGETGLLVDFFDIDGWVETLTAALARPQDYAPLRTAARRHVLANYDLRTICLPKQLGLVGALAAGRMPAG